MLKFCELFLKLPDLKVWRIEKYFEICNPMKKEFPMIRKIAVLTTTFLLFFSTQIFAQEAYQDFFRNTGKIYVVVAVLVVMFVGIVLYLLRLDSKISQLEKFIDENGKTR